MASYLIAHVQVQNPEAFREYERGVLRTIKPFGGWVLAAGQAEPLEGTEPANHNVVIRFPTLAAAQGWWQSADYQAIVPLRHAHAATTSAMFVRGLGPDVDVSGRERYPKRHANVRGKRMAYVEAGSGDPIVLLHGNPTSSYLWRNVIPHLEGARPLHRAGPDRHGRFGKARGQRPRELPLRGTPGLSGRPSGRPWRDGKRNAGGS